MRRIILVVVICVILCAILCSCTAAEVNRKPINARYTPAYNELQVEYVTYNDPDDGESYDTRNEYTLHYSAVYEIQYRVKYSNGNVAAVWETVTKEEYNAFLEDAE